MTLQLKVGDVILFNYTEYATNKWARRLLELQERIDDGKANHVGIYAGNGKILESGWQGVVFSSHVISDNPLCAVLRLKKIVNENEMNEIISKYYESHKDLGYSYKGLISAAVSTTIGFITWVATAGKIRYKPVLFKEEAAPFCSEAVAEIYEEYTGNKFEVDNDVISPNDLARATRFEKIQKFGGENE